MENKVSNWLSWIVQLCSYRTVRTFAQLIWSIHFVFFVDFLLLFILRLAHKFPQSVLSFRLLVAAVRLHRIEDGAAVTQRSRLLWSCNDQIGQHIAITAKVHFISTHNTHEPFISVLFFRDIFLVFFFCFIFFLCRVCVRSSPRRRSGPISPCNAIPVKSNRYGAAHIDHKRAKFPTIIAWPNWAESNRAIAFIPIKAISAIFTTTQNWSGIDWTDARVKPFQLLQVKYLLLPAIDGTHSQPITSNYLNRSSI